MSEVKLISMECPNCGAPLKIEENSKHSIECAWCGSTVVPVAQGTSQISPNRSDTVRIDGIKTASSVLAYIEDYFDSYDWKAFSYTKTLNIPHTIKLVDNIKNISADDKKTWFSYFWATYTPFAKKIEYFPSIEEEITAQYKKDSFGAYTIFVCPSKKVREFDPLVPILRNSRKEAEEIP